MNTRILPILLAATMLTGCSLPFQNSAGNKAHAEEKTSHQTVIPQAEKTPSTSKNVPPTYIRLANTQIDFNNLMIDCDVTKQLITVKQGDQIVRTMPTSSGLDTIPDNTTPLGTFYVQPERGTWFYSDQYQEGAKYWTSWKDHGVFLFHSVVMDKNGNIKPEEAAKLGTKASHGCFRLPVDDAKWIYDNIKVGTKVVVHK